MMIVYRSPFIPREWIAAHGLEPRRFIPDGDSVPAGPIPEVEGVCPFLRAFVNEACQLEDAAALVLTTFCDQVRRACDMVKAACDRPIHLFNLPATWQTPVSQRLYADELERLSRFLVRLGGAAPSDETLRKTMLAAHPDGVRLKPPEGFPLKGGTRTGTPLPVALLGGPMQKKDAVLFEWLEEAGAFVALDGTETGERTQPAAFSRRRLLEDPLDELCRAYFGTIPDAFRRPNAELYKWLQREVRSREIRGVLLVRYVWCDTWHAEVRRIQEWLPVPCVDLDLIADPPGARTRTRVQAFVETLT